MATKTFTVYVDTPDTDASPSSPPRVSTIKATTTISQQPLRRPSLSHTSENNSNSNSTENIHVYTAFSFNKENVDPLSGELRSSSTTSSLSKKRKTSTAGTLGTKCLESNANLNLGAVSVLQEVQILKKRKGSISSNGSVSSSAGGKSKKPTSSSSTGSTSGSKRPKSKRIASASSMPRVPEEVGIVIESTDASASVSMSSAATTATTVSLTVQSNQAQVPRLEISQTSIDAKCYELTVSPLADVSEAYGASPLGDREGGLRSFVRDTSTEPVLRDYFSPEPSVLGLSRSTSGSGSNSLSRSTSFSGSREKSVEPTVFSTPERKEIYEVFTFRTPEGSPSAKKEMTLEELGPGADCKERVMS